MRHTRLVGLTCALVIAASTFTATRSDAAQERPDPAHFSPVITNRYFPLAAIDTKIFEGTDTDPDTGEVVETRLESRVLPDTIVVDGVTVTVLEEKAYDDGELVEIALDYFAQHDNGDVWYFGEHVENYEEGEFKDNAGQWLSGVDGARAGIYIAANPAVGDTYEQELAPGVAEDKSTVLAVGESITVPAGTYTDCVRTRDYTPLEPGIEEIKWHCAGAGLTRETGTGSVNELVSLDPAVAGPAPTATAQGITATAVASTATPAAGIVAPNTGGTNASEDLPAASIAIVIATVALGGAGAFLVAKYVRARGR